jgi:hypothetical protein
MTLVAPSSTASGTVSLAPTFSPVEIMFFASFTAPPTITRLSSAVPPGIKDTAPVTAIDFTKALSDCCFETMSACSCVIWPFLTLVANNFCVAS